MTLRDAALEMEYIIQRVSTNDAELDAFLFSLGCYEGAPIAVIFRQKNNYIVALKGSRYSIDNALAESIFI